MPVPESPRAVTALLLLLLACPGYADAPSRNGIVPLAGFPRERLALETRASFRRVLFDAWRADTPATREQGLMFVKDSEMRPDQAMIFIYDPPAPVSMWMKNTELSLDMLFVDARGCIASIQERAVPHSLSTIGSGGPIALVVELKAGVVAGHSIRVGDRVLRLDAGWPKAPGSCR